MLNLNLLLVFKALNDLTRRFQNSQSSEQLLLAVSRSRLRDNGDQAFVEAAPKLLFSIKRPSKCSGPLPPRDEQGSHASMTERNKGN